jgi:hypothetical protein
MGKQPGPWFKKVYRQLICRHEWVLVSEISTPLIVRRLDPGRTMVVRRVAYRCSKCGAVNIRRSRI